MNRPRYESLGEARTALEERLSSGLVDDAFDVVEMAAEELVDEYELEDEVDPDKVRRSLQIGWCESAVGFVEDEVWEGEEDVREVIKSIERNPTSNAMTIAGSVARRNQDMMRVSNAILKQKYSSGG